jgi:acyl-CoA reductase-like NAD-dependent aldehyde dehydrogenase
MLSPISRTTSTRTAVLNPYDGSIVGHVDRRAPADVNRLMQRAHSGFQISRALSRARRAQILEGAARIVADRADQFAKTIVLEAGKTIRQARKEVARCVNTLKLSADESKRNAGEVIPFDAYDGSENKIGFFKREPLGIIVAITPYNDPLNLVAHKLGPAIAGGNSVILKPSDLAPISATKLVTVLIEAGLPEEVVTIACGDGQLGAALVAERDVRMISFTGGFKTGSAIARTAGLKKLAMDLGGNAPVIVLADCDIDLAIECCVSGAFWAAGQNCIGTQRILIERAIFEQFCVRFADRTRALRYGDPRDEATDVGPMITEEAAIEAQQKVNQAIADGAVLLAGHQRTGSLYSPTVLMHTPHHCSLWNEEAFAPVVTLHSFDTFEEALELANSSPYSLHAGIFTSSIDKALRAADVLDAGGVMINDSSDYRFDAMPFGGFKYGSLGREGVRFAYEDMTQTKVVCFNSPRSCESDLPRSAGQSQHR